MHITLETDYAVRIVYCLACQQVRMDAKAISEATGVTLRFSLKILRKLVSGGLVQSYKGTKGGYELAKPPKDISLADVIQTVEGKFALSRCVSEEEYQCSRCSGNCADCRFHQVYADISQMVQQRLEQVRFSDFLEEEKANPQK